MALPSVYDRNYERYLLNHYLGNLHRRNLLFMTPHDCIPPSSSRIQQTTGTMMNINGAMLCSSSTPLRCKSIVWSNDGWSDATLESSDLIIATSKADAALAA